jgi:hypothetical protein
MLKYRAVGGTDEQAFELEGATVAELAEATSRRDASWWWDLFERDGQGGERFAGTLCGGRFVVPPEGPGFDPAWYFFAGMRPDGPQPEQVPPGVRLTHDSGNQGRWWLQPDSAQLPELEECRCGLAPTMPVHYRIARPELPAL